MNTTTGCVGGQTLAQHYVSTSGVLMYPTSLRQQQMLLSLFAQQHLPLKTPALAWEILFMANFENLFFAATLE